MYFIWSWRHSQWWGPEHQGYTPNANKAGVYAPAEAGNIVVSSGMPGNNTPVNVKIGFSLFKDYEPTQIEEELDHMRRV